jgi:hypothetical protein
MVFNMSPGCWDTYRQRSAIIGRSLDFGWHRDFVTLAWGAGTTRPLQYEALCAQLSQAAVRPQLHSIYARRRQHLQKQNTNEKWREASHCGLCQARTVRRCFTSLDLYILCRHLYFVDTYLFVSPMFLSMPIISLKPIFLSAPIFWLPPIFWLAPVFWLVPIFCWCLYVLKF